MVISFCWTTMFLWVPFILFLLKSWTSYLYSFFTACCRDYFIQTRRIKRPCKMAFTVSNYRVRWKAYGWCNWEYRDVSCSSWALFKGCSYCSLSGTFYYPSAYFNTSIGLGFFVLWKWSSCILPKKWSISFDVQSMLNSRFLFTVFIRVLGWTNIPVSFLYALWPVVMLFCWGFILE